MTYETFGGPESQDAVREEMKKIRETVEENAERVAKLGKWPAYIEPASLSERVPAEGGADAPGFDAGIACSLDLIPRDRQELAATLHANYSKEAVAQVRHEFAEGSPDSQTTWWLAACSICEEGEIDEKVFLKQIEDFQTLAADTEARHTAAVDQYKEMTASFELRNGVPYGEKDGCIQGAYIAGYTFGSHYSKEYGLYFVGTYEPSLGLEDFEWSQEVDDQGRAKSGPVFGSKQFVKCANEEEWNRVMDAVKATLPLRDDEKN
jgi:hypothetical protein